MVKYLVLIFATVQIAAGQTWVGKIPASTTVLGVGLASNPRNSGTIYAVPGGRRMYISRDRGYTWQPYGIPVPQVGAQDNVVKSIAVNPRDTLQMVLGVESASSTPDRIMKTTDGGSSWTQTWGGTFAYYGKPVEFKPVHPDTLYTMGSDTLWRSTDFGSTWGIVRTTTGLFSAWCDAEVRPDSANIMFLGDFSTGIWKTKDFGHTWRKVFATTGEIPSIAIDPLHPRVMYATRFSGGGGVLKSTDGGENWNVLVTPLADGPGWWITCSPVDPGYVYFGVYGANPGGIYVSADFGNSWRLLAAGLSPTALINYGILALDTLTVVASQIDGIWRLQYPGSVHVTGPNGGEALLGGTPHAITWTASNLYSLRIDASTNNGASWTTLKDSIPPSQSSYSWTPPAVLATQCRVRVSDDILPYVSDASDTTFTVYLDPLTLKNPLGGELWTTGSSRSIDWVAYNVPAVRLEYSTDNGSVWNYITSLSSYPRTYRWIVPDNPSNECRIRISDAGDSTLFRISDSAFTISRAAAFRGTLMISDNGLNLDSLKFGMHDGATDGIDPAFGESALPPKPGSGTFDVRWRIPAGAGTKIDMRDTLPGGQSENIYTAELQPGPAGYPMTLIWNPESLSAGTFILRDTLTHGSVASVDMRNAGSVTIHDASVSAVEIIQCKSIWFTFGGGGGWNLMSIPVDAGDLRKASLFPNALSAAFAYAGGYVRLDTIRRGTGYWLKAEQVTVVGCPFTHDTVAVSPGWNMIGALSYPVSVSSIVVAPGDLLTSKFFGYENSYTIADSIRPGSGYWVRAKEPGTLVLSAAPAAVWKTAGSVTASPGFNSLTVSDESNHSQVLYFGLENSGINADSYDMPPAPPEGSFDACFAGRRMLAAHPANLEKPADFPILISPGAGRLKFSWRVGIEQKFSYILIESLGDKRIGELRLTGAGSAVMPRADQLRITLSARQSIQVDQIPGEYSLGHMYPNPFNPVTHFTYTLPSESRVSIRVYNILGEEVRSLVDGAVRPGVYQAEWPGDAANGTPAGSGVYYIRMTAASPGGSHGEPQSVFSDVRKVLLIR